MLTLLLLTCSIFNYNFANNELLMHRFIVYCFRTKSRRSFNISFLCIYIYIYIYIYALVIINIHLFYFDLFDSINPFHFSTDPGCTLEHPAGDTPRLHNNKILGNLKKGGIRIFLENFFFVFVSFSRHIGSTLLR